MHEEGQGVASADGPCMLLLPRRRCVSRASGLPDRRELDSFAGGSDRVALPGAQGVISCVPR